MKTDSAQFSEQARIVQAMFQRIAPRYDLMNRLMTGGQDITWRKLVVQKANIPPDGRVLDLGAGTGDLSREALRQVPDCHPTAADFTLGMMLSGKAREGKTLPGRAPNWTGADALHLPFADGIFDSVISGFLLRNVVDLPLALEEQFRVLKPGGWWVALDTTRPRPTLVSPFVRLYMRRVIPFLGDLLTGERDAYVYLPSTSENFLWAEDLKERVLSAGFEKAAFRRLMIGTIAIHWAKKPYFSV